MGKPVGNKFAFPMNIPMGMSSWISMGNHVRGMVFHVKSCRRHGFPCKMMGNRGFCGQPPSGSPRESSQIIGKQAGPPRGHSVAPGKRKRELPGRAERLFGARETYSGAGWRVLVAQKTRFW